MGYKLRHEPSLTNMHEFEQSYRDLVRFYNNLKDLKTKEEIEARIEYVLKHKLKQLNEIETLKWVLGESTLEENINETKDIA